MKRMMFCFVLAIIGVMSSFAEVRIGDPCAVSSYPLIASDRNNHVYAIWTKTFGNNAHLMFNFSADNGDTWRAQNVSLGRISPISYGTLYHAISCDQVGNAYIIRFESDSVYVTVFSNYGRNSKDVRLESFYGETFLFDKAMLACDDQGHVYTVLTPLMEGGASLYVSSDFGASWERRLPPANFPYTGGLHSQIYCDSIGTIYFLSLIDEENGGHTLRLWRSSDRGVFWPVSGEMIASYQKDNPITPPAPSFYGDASGIVYVAWVDMRNGKGDIYICSSRDFGLTWPIRGKRVNRDADGQYPHYNPQIAADSLGHVYVAWVKNASTFPWTKPLEHVNFNYSRNFGATWQPSDTIMDRWVLMSDSSRTTIHYPGVTCDTSGRVNVVWLEDRPYGDNVIHRQSSTDYGQHWLPFLNNISNDLYVLARPSAYSPVGATTGPPGEAFYIWTSSESVSSSASEVTFAKCRAVQPPANIQVQYGFNRTLFKKEDYDTITWEDHPLNVDMNIEAYVVCWKYESDADDTYNVEKAEVKTVAADVHSYSFRYPITEERRVYALYSVDDWGIFSPVSPWISGQ